jgi:hypothetical protein
MVPLVKVGLQTPPRMQRYWSEDDVGMPKVGVESSRGVDGKLGLNVESSPQYYHKQGHWNQWHLITMKQ